MKENNFLLIGSIRTASEQRCSREMGEEVFTSRRVLTTKHTWQKWMMVLTICLSTVTSIDADPQKVIEGMVLGSCFDV